MRTKELGNYGERVACEYLVKKGYKILVKNYRISFGEIDIIARKKWRLFGRNDKTIHFIEVKTLLQNDSNNRRSSIIRDDSFFPEERVDYKKQRKLNQLSQIWLEKNKFPQNYPCQIDIMGILIPSYCIKNQSTPLAVECSGAKLSYFQNVVEDL